MLYTLRLLIGAQRMTNTTAENRKLMIGFCLQALEMSRHRLFVPSNGITAREQEWLLKLETVILEFLHSASVDDAEDAVAMYVDALKSVGVKFYGGSYPLVLVEVLCNLCTKYERLKVSQGRDLVQISAEILLSLTSCLNKLTLTADFYWEGSSLALLD